MKKLIFILILISAIPTFAQQQEKFIIGAEHVSSFQDFGGPLDHSNNYWDTVKSLGINYAGLKYFQKYPITGTPVYGSVPLSAIIADLNKAAALDIDVYLTNGFDRYTANDIYYPKRWLYQVENVTGNDFNDFINISTGEILNDNNPDPSLRALTHWNLAPPPPEGIENYLQLRPGEHSYGTIASNLREKNLQPDGLNYYLKIRMRLPSAPSFPNTNVLTVRILKDGYPQTAWGRTIKASDFNNNNWKEIFVIAFYKTPGGPSPHGGVIDEATVYDFPDTIGTNQLPNYQIKAGVLNTDYDIEIEWHNTGFTVDIDYVAVDDETANSLYAGQFNGRIDDFANNYKNHSAVQNFLVWDETSRENYFPVKYYNDKIQSVLSGNKNPLCYRVVDGQLTKRFIHETGMQIVMTDIYPITLSLLTPLQTGYTVALQNQLQQGLIPYFNEFISYSNNFNKPFWFTTQAHKWIPGLVTPLREPSAYEIKAMANLAVCYGAKGINYYIFTNNSDAGTDNRIGLLQNNNSNPLPRYIDAYNYPKWETVKQLNLKLASIGNELLSLTWQGAKSWHNGSVAGFWSGIISNVTTNFSETKYVETGHFTNASSVDYIFVVNRRTLNTDQRNIRVYINKSSSIFNNWKISEAGTSNTWTVSKTGNFITSYQPGEGKLFRMEPVMIAGGTLSASNENIPAGTSINVQGNVTVPLSKSVTIGQGSTLNFQNGSVITINGTLNSQGISNNKVTFDFISPDPVKSNGIKINQGATANILYTVIKNAADGIYANKVHPLIDGCEIFNCTRGIYFYNLNTISGTAAILNNNIYSNAYGIYLYNSSPDIRNNAIASITGIYCSQNSSPKLGELNYYGNNIITVSNYSVGIYAYQSSNPFLGEDECIINGGDNQISNTSNSYYIHANFNCNILAEKNWWNANPPSSSKFLAQNGSTIDYIPYLTSPPSDNFAIISDDENEGSPEEEVFDETFGNREKNQPNIDVLIITYDPNWPIGRKLRFARSLVYLGRNGFAQTICKQIITEHPDSALSFFALDILLEAARNADEGSDLGLNTLRVYLANLIQNGYPNRLIGAAGLSFASMQSNGGLNIINQIINHFPGTHIGEAALFKKFMYYLFDEGNREMAIEVMEEIDLSYPDSQSSDEAHNFIEGVSILPKLASEGNNKLNIPNKYELFGNYPNPFNPSTMIRYNLPYQSEIELIIFDIIGKEVRTFKNLIQSAGTQNLIWDGRNNYSESLASGVYLYRIKAKSIEGNNEVFEKSAKLILLK